MASKYFTVEVKPTITASKQAAFANKDVLFDWTSFQVPRGASKLLSVNVTLRGTNGTTQTPRDFDLYFAKTIDGTAPATLGTINATVTAAPIVFNHIIGNTHIDSSGDYGAGGFDYGAVAQTGSGAAASLVPSLVLQGEPDSGDNVGYDTLYIGGIAGAALDFGTTVISRGAASATATSVPTDAGSDDDPNADLIFAVGDTIHSATDDVLGTLTSIAAFDTNNQALGFSAGTTATVADNEELFNIHPMKIILSFER